MNPTQIRGQIVSEFEKTLQNVKARKIVGLSKSDAYGHEAGMPVESWAINVLRANGWKAYYPNEFLAEVFSGIGKDEIKITRALTNIWWAPLLVSRQQIKKFISGEVLGRWQQEGADIVLKYGASIEQVILINVKSHESKRSSRPPNIMSAQRLIEFFHGILRRNAEMINRVELWFLGVYYSASEKGAEASSVFIRDLFKLDTSQIPQINFDAAIQIQWHIEDMVEIQQSKPEFIKRLAETFITEWRTHSRSKTKKYEKLVGEISHLIKSYK